MWQSYNLSIADKKENKCPGRTKVTTQHLSVVIAHLYIIFLSYHFIDIYNSFYGDLIVGGGSGGRGGPAKAKAKARAERATAWREKVRKAKVERRAEQVKKKVEHGWQRSKRPRRQRRRKRRRRERKRRRHWRRDWRTS